MTVFDDGSGPKLIVGGTFRWIGGQRAGRIASWDGDQWETVGGGLSHDVYALAVHDDGAGPALYVGGDGISRAGDPSVPVNQIARWDGQEWTDAGGPSYGGGGSYVVWDFETHDDGSGRSLYAARSGTSDPLTVPWLVARLDGDIWTPIGNSNLSYQEPGFSAQSHAYTLTSFDDGTGQKLYAGGWLYTIEDSKGLAAWDGSDWEHLDLGVTSAVADIQEVETAGSNPELWVSGQFEEAGGVSADYIARWVGCEQTCYADCDDSGDLDFFDFLCFQNAFAAGEAYADCDESGDLDFFDFLCFQNEFAAGCP